jgi:RHS repeat-associated protein
VGDQTEISKRYRYTGKEKDRETGLYHMGVRYCMAGVARWTSADLKGIADSFNIFAYARANPIAFTDSSGTSRDELRKGAQTRIVYNYGDSSDYYVNGVRGDVEASLGKNVSQSHVMSVDIWKWLTGGAYDRRASATGKLTYQGQYFELGREQVILNPTLLEEMIGEHMKPVVASLKSGNIDNVDELLTNIKSAYKAAHAKYDAFIQANSDKAPGKPVAFSKDTFDLIGMDVKERMTKAGIPQSGYKEIAAANNGPPTPPSTSPSGSPPPSTPPGDEEPPSGGGGGGSAPPAAPETPPTTPPPIPSSAPIPKPSAMSRLGAGLRAAGGRVMGGVRAGGGYARAFAGAALESSARLLLPGYAEFALAAEAQVFSYSAIATSAPAAVAQAATVAGAAPLATYVGLVAAPAVGGALVGGAVGDLVREHGGSDAAARTGGAIAGAATGAAIGAAVGVWFLEIGAPVGAAVGGAIGAIAGAWASW